MADPGKFKPGREGVTFHLDRDPNDPRLLPPADANSSLNEEDPELERKPQNPVPKEG